jgi:hypothetical protein
MRHHAIFLNADTSISIAATTLGLVMSVYGKPRAALA